MTQATQITRLAPSPTGALHLGNARTFLVNWALARRHGWQIVLRIEDLDSPRVKPATIDQTIDILRWLGVDWDAGPILQSHDPAPYREAMTRLARTGMVYPCRLSRTEIESAASAPQEGSTETRFDPALRPGLAPCEFHDIGTNWRYAVPDADVRFSDEFRGEQTHNPARTVGDFVVWTKREQPAYQLAVVVDDARQGVTRIVRGDDLLDSTPRQMLLARSLGIEAQVRYMHLPLVRGGDGRRLAKRHGDTRLLRYRELGVPPERVIALIGRWCGICGVGEGLSAGDFRDALEIHTMPRQDVVFGAGDERWILEKS